MQGTLIRLPIGLFMWEIGVHYGCRVSPSSSSIRLPAVLGVVQTLARVKYLVSRPLGKTVGLYSMMSPVSPL